MSIQQILKSWGIIISDEYSYLPEFLLKNYSEKCYFADFFPKKILKTYAAKYGQIESEVYDLICERMYKVILKFWVYDNLYFESELLHSKNSWKYSNIRRKLSKNMITNCVETKDQLSLLLQLSKENIIDLALAFEEIHMIIIPSWSCFFVFIEDNASLQLMKNIFESEGLYLRKAQREDKEDRGLETTE